MSLDFVPFSISYVPDWGQSTAGAFLLRSRVKNIPGISTSDLSGIITAQSAASVLSTGTKKFQHTQLSGNFHPRRAIFHSNAGLTISFIIGHPDLMMTSIKAIRTRLEAASIKIVKIQLKGEHWGANTRMSEELTPANASLPAPAASIVPANIGPQPAFVGAMEGYESDAEFGKIHVVKFRVLSQDKYSPPAWVGDVFTSCAGTLSQGMGCALQRRSQFQYRHLIAQGFTDTGFTQRQSTIIPIDSRAKVRACISAALLKGAVICLAYQGESRNDLAHLV